MAASAEGQRVSVCARPGDRPLVEHHCHRRVGRTETARGTLPADWQFERTCALGFTRGGATGESNRDGADRTAPPANGGLHSERDGAARRGVLDVARSGAALRDCGCKRCADTNYGNRELDVEDEEDSHSRRRAVQDPAVDAVLLVAEGCRAVPWSV